MHDQTLQDDHPSGPPHRPVVSQSIERSYDLQTHTVVTTVTTDQSFDAYGNPTDITVTTNGGGLTVVTGTDNVYQNDTADWLLGRLEETTVTHTRGAQSAKRRASFDYDLDTGHRLQP